MIYIALMQAHPTMLLINTSNKTATTYLVRKVQLYGGPGVTIYDIQSVAIATHNP